MSRVLKLYNSFTRSINNVLLNGQLLSVQNNCRPARGSLYICGPTVYSDSHLGHALTYVRADLFRRFMKFIFNVRLTTVMNITDIDDKILAKARQESGGNILKDEISNVEKSMDPIVSGVDPAKHPFQKVSDRYYKSFLKDMNSLRVLPADLTLRVSRQTHLIISYIKKLEKTGHAYVGENGDIYFRVMSIPNYEGRVDNRQQELNVNPSKSDPRDFALWKASKPDEPVWYYRSELTGKVVPGRPGWHVQCSAISSRIFGRQLDFHYGGRDLIFPHHYNEEACCCAYYELDTSKTIHVWSNNWLHSGHMILRDEKMSKSLGNVISVDNFINRSSVNALRLLCLTSHYRSNVEYSEDLLNDLKSLDHKISAFISFIKDRLKQTEMNELEVDEEISGSTWESTGDIRTAIDETRDEIIDGVCDDFDLGRGLAAILKLAQTIYATDVCAIQPTELVDIWNLMQDWCNECGLEYGHLGASQNGQLVDLVQEFRQNVRNLALNELKNGQASASSRELALKSQLSECDRMRFHLDELGFVTRDSKT